MTKFAPWLPVPRTWLSMFNHAWVPVHQYDHLNHASALPPVACPLVIEVPGRGMLRAERTSFVAHKGNEMEYRLSDGSILTGRFRWTYP